MDTAPDLFGYRKHWAHKLGTAPELPMSRDEMDLLGWDSCDVIIVTGDAYVDHASFGMALIGRLLEAQGFRVGIIAQPDWTSADAFQALGPPNLCFGVGAGNMDSMVNRYTADRCPRSDDAYSPGGAGGRRPDRSVLVYAQRAREAYPGVPILLGGIEASLRRVAHYDYWSDQVRRSMLVDSKADLLVFGNAERAICEVVHRLARGEPVGAIRDVRGTAFLVPGGERPDGFVELDVREPDGPGATQARSGARALSQRPAQRARTVLRLPSFEQVRADPVRYAHAARWVHLETNPGNARALVQAHGDRDLWLNPPPIPLTTAEMDRLYELPFSRRPHSAYGDARIPAWEMIRFSVTIMRGCFGGCAFCSITEHEGRIIQNRSEASVLAEIAEIRDRTPGFTGTISDMGGPSANMYRLACRDPKIESACRRLSCVYPEVCRNMATDHSALIELYRKARAVPGVKRVLIASGLRYDLAVHSPAYVRELVTHHVGGYLKIAPEHTEGGPLALMMKPGIGSFERFRQMFDRFSREAGKEQYLIPYFIAAHPGTSDEDMLNLALWLKRNRFRPDAVQAFLPTPMALSTVMYHTGRNPLKPVGPGAERVSVARRLRQRRLHKAFLRWHDPDNWPLLREALRTMGRADLIGNGKRHLVPSFQPAGTGSRRPGDHRAGQTPSKQTSQQTGTLPSKSAVRPARKQTGKPGRKSSIGPANGPGPGSGRTPPASGRRRKPGRPR
ncbi:YgiQ family radical SAM protein [Thiohalocapsa marina]|uniref:YgiQ family radical SAM protein n=1 Tax=Thiohalocapsa marina TaxID=424902 RepID=A0A5M8FPW1_9GAMM|nr:YgiQ family radical SAM protein [Thiohalocapsa marina]KAA6184465.1 YgiQ family radical SAM protein [Thiohalocapsa marina]